MSGLILRLVREPLLHFLALGAVLFVVLGRGDHTPPTGEIVITREDVGRIAAGFAATWQRPPSQEEMKRAIADDVREEVLYRAGTDLGLDKNDTIVRRRIAQKMQFFLEGTIDVPTESDLQQFLDRNLERFRTDRRFAFRQIFLSSKRPDAKQEAEALLPKLASAGPEARFPGDATLLPEVFELQPVRDIASQFGAAFAQGLSTAKTGVWSGPIASAYGYHLVMVTSTEPARVPRLGEVRLAVEREWYAERRAAVLDVRYQELLSRYSVRIDNGSAGP